MNENKSVKKWVMYGFGFLFGRAFLWGINPFVTAFFAVAYMLGDSSFALLISIALGMITAVLNGGTLNGEIYMFGELNPNVYYIIGRYIALIVVVALIMSLQVIRKRKLYVLLAGAVFTASFVSISPYMELYYGFFYAVSEMMITMCLIPVLNSAFKVLIHNDYDKNRYNEQMLSIMCISAICLWGIPTEVFGKVLLLEVAALLLALYVIHRYGAGYGVGITCISGTIMAIRCGIPEYIGTCFIMAVFALAIRALSGKRKFGTLAGFVIGGVVAGLTYFDYFIGAAGLKLLGSVSLLYAAIPRMCLTVKDGYTLGIHSEAAAIEMNRITAEKIRDMAGAFKRIEYTLAGCGPAAGRVSLSQIGDMIGRFSENLENVEDAGSGLDRLQMRLSEQGLVLLHMTVLRNEQNHKQYFLTGRTNSRRIVLAKEVAAILSEEFHENIRVAMNTSAIFSENDRTVTFEEEAGYKCYYHVRRIKKYGSQVSGDNFSVKESEDGRLVIMISDGMGSGSLAACESGLLIDTMEELIEAGFDPLYGISFSNECLSEKNNGKTFTTFDMGIIDLYEGRLKSYKQGAAATYVVHVGMNENDVEIIRGTTLPIGVLAHTECDVSEAELGHGDAVIMVSDGIYSCDRQNDEEDLMLDILRHIDTGNSRDIVEEIINEMLCANEGSFQDDVTVIAAVLEKNETL
ncbi:MAG: SpoIIE family protein phosphatase [Coprococcus sp.]|nr:SpoIIE family protein phosphatase [Coprococcus sp.]